MKIDPKTLPFGEVNQCLLCRHLIKSGKDFTRPDPTGWRCEAFGDADVPIPIVRGRFDHREPWPDEPSDHGVLFQDLPGDIPYTWEDMMGPLRKTA